MVFTLDRQPF